MGNGHLFFSTFTSVKSPLLIVTSSSVVGIAGMTADGTLLPAARRKVGKLNPELEFWCVGVPVGVVMSVTNRKVLDN